MGVTGLTLAWRRAAAAERPTLGLELAQEGDPVDDPTGMWPEGHRRVVMGRLELLRRGTEAEIGDEVMLHDPTAVTDGIETSPGDQIVAVRRGAYLVSVAERTGGWQRRAEFPAAAAASAPEQRSAPASQPRTGEAHAAEQHARRA